MKQTATGIWRSPFPTPTRTLGSDAAITDKLMEVGKALTELAMRNERREAPKDIERGILEAISDLCDTQVSLTELHKTDTSAAIKSILRDKYKDAVDVTDYVREEDEEVI